MKGYLISTTHAVINIRVSPADTGQATVKLHSETNVTPDMIGKDFEFALTVPCVQFCGRPKICSYLHCQVCEEAIVQIVDEI